MLNRLLDSAAGAPLLALIEAIVNRALAAAPEARARLAPLAGRLLRVHLDDLRLAIDVRPDAEGLRFAPALAATTDAAGDAPIDVVPGAADAAAAPDASVHTTLAALARLFARRGEKVRPDALAIEGDAAFAQELFNVLAAVEIDWEERLSQFTGDAAAHQIGRAARSAQRWLQETRARAGSDVRDYLQAELSLLPTAHEVEQHLQEVDRLRHDIERIAARIERLRSVRTAPDRPSARP